MQQYQTVYTITLRGISAPQKSVLAKLLKAQKKSKTKKAKTMDDNVVKSLNKIFKMKLKNDTTDNVVHQIVSGADLTSPKIKAVAKLYSMHSNYQSAGKTTNRTSFVHALIKKLE